MEWEKYEIIDIKKSKGVEGIGKRWWGMGESQKG